MNDYLEIFVHGGIVGGILYIIFIAGLIVVGIRNREKTLFATIGICAFSIMSLTNSPLFYQMTSFLFICYASIINMHSKAICNIHIKKNKSLIIPGIFVVMLLCAELIQAHSQIQTKRLYLLSRERETSEMETILQSKIHLISTSELFYRVCAGFYMIEKNYPEALVHFEKTLTYSYEPVTLMQKSYCEFMLQNTDAAIKDLQAASFIQPALFEPYFHMMHIYRTTGNAAMAINMAETILKKEVKVNSEKVEHYKQDAEKVLKYYQSQ